MAPRVNSVNSISAQLGRLSVGAGAGINSIGTPQTTSGARFYASSKKRRMAMKEKKEKGLFEDSEYAAGFGEKIWVHHHFNRGYTVLAFSPVLKIPFLGKKLRPRNFRKDFWRPMAMIQFPEGRGDVGRSVFHLMRECRQLQDLAWGDFRLGSIDGKPLTRQERGRELIRDQRANTVANMAAVLAGCGKGGRIWVDISKGDPKDVKDIDASVGKLVKRDGETVKALCKADVWWMDDNDQHYAKHWSPNVTHHRFDQATRMLLGGILRKLKGGRILPEHMIPRKATLEVGEAH
ncbi:hypothetical protein F4779DRAFT_613447 [Xylariaceae sp. FL0662B]|nr:hypothetical protein F4779DRAFT_613447 [Xylariaceae sp. FL0662B]